MQAYKLLYATLIPGKSTGASSQLTWHSTPLSKKGCWVQSILRLREELQQIVCFFLSHISARCVFQKTEYKQTADRCTTPRLADSTVCVFAGNKLVFSVKAGRRVKALGEAGAHWLDSVRPHLCSDAAFAFDRRAFRQTLWKVRITISGFPRLRLGAWVG